MFLQYNIDFKYSSSSCNINIATCNIIARDSIEDAVDYVIGHFKHALELNRLSYDEIVEIINEQYSPIEVDYDIIIIDISSFSRSPEEITVDFNKKLRGKMPNGAYNSGWNYLTAGYEYYVKIMYDGSTNIERYACIYNPINNEVDSECLRCEIGELDQSTFDKFKKGDIIRYTGGYREEDTKDDLYIMEFDWYRNPVDINSVHWPTTMDIRNLRTGEVLVETHPVDMEPVRPSTTEERRVADKDWFFGFCDSDN